MAVTGLNSKAILNADNLLVKYGSGEALVTRGGEYDFDGEHWTEVDVDLSVLTTSGQTILGDGVTLPNGAFIRRVQVIVTKEPTDASGTANLDLGLVSQTDRSTEIDFNGLLAAADAFNSGTDLGRTVDYDLGTTEVGALVGTKLTSTGLICANAETAVFTAGQLKIRILWFVPLAADL